MATVAETLVDTLSAAGVDTVFGLPGGEVVEILDALRRRNLRFVLAHNESSAVFMADAMARMTGKPGVAPVPRIALTMDEAAASLGVSRDSWTSTSPTSSD